MSRSDLAAYVAESRRSQGLPARVEDPVVLARVAALLTFTAA